METLGSEWCVDDLWCLVPALKTDCPAVGHNLSNHCYWKQQVQQSETLSPSHRSLSETTSEQSADSASHPWLGDCQVNNQHQLRVVKTAWQITDFPLSAGDHHCCVGRGNTIYPHHRPTVCLHCCHLGEDTLATKLKLVTQKNTFFSSTHEPFPALSYRLPRLWILTVSYTRVSFFFSCCLKKYVGGFSKLQIIFHTDFYSVILSGRDQFCLSGVFFFFLTLSLRFPYLFSYTYLLDVQPLLKGDLRRLRIPAVIIEMCWHSVMTGIVEIRQTIRLQQKWTNIITVYFYSSTLSF